MFLPYRRAVDVEVTGSSLHEDVTLLTRLHHHCLSFTIVFIHMSCLSSYIQFIFGHANLLIILTYVLTRLVSPKFYGNLSDAGTPNECWSTTTSVLRMALWVLPVTCVLTSRWTCARLHVPVIHCIFHLIVGTAQWTWAVQMIFNSPQQPITHITWPGKATKLLRLL